MQTDVQSMKNSMNRF